MDKQPTTASRCVSALKAIEDTKFVPAWGQARLHAMIANRPDWCISRQRNWGVPIPFFLHKETGELHPRTVELMEEVAKRVEQEGIEAWFKLDAAELLGAEAASTTRSATPSTCGSTPAPPTGTCCAARTTSATPPARAPTCTWKAPTSTAAGSTRPADRLRHRQPRAVPRAADPRLHRRRERPQDVAGQHHRAAEGQRHPGRRHPAPVGFRHRLLRRNGGFRADPAAQRRRYAVSATPRASCCPT
jgi:hypothetical protein